MASPLEPTVENPYRNARAVRANGVESEKAGQSGFRWGFGKLRLAGMAL
jgi:hypothetical protein